MRPVFSGEMVRVQQNIEKLSAMIRAVPCQLVLLVWQTKVFQKRYASEGLVEPTIPMIRCYILGVIEKEPILSEWDSFALPVSRYLKGDRNDQILSGPIGMMEAAHYGFRFSQLNDPEPEEYRFAHQYTGLNVFPGDERVKGWFIKQETLWRNGHYLSELWLACQKLEYVVDMPELDVVIDARRAGIIEEFAHLVLSQDSSLRNTTRFLQLRERVLDYRVDLEKVAERAQVEIRHLLGLP